MSPQRYSLTAITLHWLIALLLAFQLALGWMLDGPSTPALFARFQLHKSVGILILVLSLARLALRFTRPRPAPMEGPAWARALAGLVHALFYVVMIGTPISGWIMVSTAKIKVPTLLFGTIPLPHLPVSTAMGGPAAGIHGLLATLAVGLFALHVAGALRHQWLLGKPALQRMIPFAQGRAVGSAIGALALIGGALFLGRTVYSERTTPAPATTDAPALNETTPDAINEVENAATALNAATNVATPDNAATPTNATEAAQKQPLADWTITSGGRIGFTAHWNGEAINGAFKSWQAAIRFSPDDLAASTIRVTIDLASVDTADSQRDDSLKGSDFFDTAAHPVAIFTARAIRRVSGERYEAAGTLNLHGVTRPVTLRFTLRITDDKARVSGSSRIDRTSFGIGKGEWASTEAIAGAVDIAFSFDASRK